MIPVVNGLDLKLSGGKVFESYFPACVDSLFAYQGVPITKQLDNIIPRMFGNIEVQDQVPELPCLMSFKFAADRIIGKSVDPDKNRIRNKDNLAFIFFPFCFNYDEPFEAVSKMCFWF